jgi:hypothetical protein
MTKRDYNGLVKLALALVDLGNEIPMEGTWAASRAMDRAVEAARLDVRGVAHHELSGADDWLDQAEAKLDAQGRSKEAKRVGKIRERMATIRVRLS